MIHTGTLFAHPVPTDKCPRATPPAASPRTTPAAAKCGHTHPLRIMVPTCNTNTAPMRVLPTHRNADVLHRIKKLFATPLGGVYRAQLQPCMEKVVGCAGAFALKVYNLKKMDAMYRRAILARTRVAEDVEQEWAVLRAVAASPHPGLMSPHPCNATLHRVLRARSFAFVALPLACEDLMVHLQRRRRGGAAPPMRVDCTRRIMRELVAGVAHLHALGWAHMDISLENILVMQGGGEDDTGSPLRVALADYGAVLPVDATHMRIKVPRGKVAYMAPEVFARRAFQPKAADVYSLGIVLATMLLGSFLYHRPSPTDAMYRLAVLQEGGGLDHLLKAWRVSTTQFPAAARALLRGMLHPDPDARFTLARVAGDPWLNGLERTVCVCGCDPRHTISKCARAEPAALPLFVDCGHDDT